MRPLLFALTLFGLPSFSAAESCAEFSIDPLSGFVELDALRYLDLPDPETTRATSVIESSFVDRVVAGEISGFTKRWCQIGITQFVLDFEVPVEDDAVAAQVTRAVYEWNAQEDPVGWQIIAMGERFRCARGDDPFEEVCP